jgi:Uma2 family endonuclease
MTAPAPTQDREKMTVAQFEAYIALPENRDRRLELIEGEIVETMPTLIHNLVSLNILMALIGHVKSQGLGRVIYETSYRASESDDQNYRIPDLSYTTPERLTPIPERGAVPQIPDICIEIQSPDDDPGEMRRKSAYYLENGAREVWLIFTKRPRVEVMYPDGDSDFFNTDDVLTSTVLPDFRMKVADIFDVEGK